MKQLRKGKSGSTVIMTLGIPAAQILRFSVPLVFGNLFQQMYSIIDAAVIGNYVGVEAFAAVGCTGWVCWLINCFFRDSANAFSIPAAICIGKKDREGFHKIVVNAVLYGVVLSFVGTILLALTLHTILRLLNVPENIYQCAGQYLLVYILGIPLGMTFSLATALLRADGNSEITFRAMTASTITNVALDLLLVVVFRAGVLGAAIATWLASGVAAVLALEECAKREKFHFALGELRPDFGILQEITRLFLPMFFNSVIIAFGGLYVQKNMNALGSSFTAGISAQSKIFGVLEAVIMAVQTSLGVFVSQNLGARKPLRIRQGLLQCTVASLLLTAVLVGVTLNFREPILKLFLSTKDAVSYAQAMQVAKDATRMILYGMGIMTAMYLHRVAIQALHHPEFSAIAGVCQLIARVVTIAIGSSVIGKTAYFITDCAAWLVSLPIVAIPCYILLHKMIKEESAGQVGKQLV